jgi:hypothetical protein
MQNSLINYGYVDFRGLLLLHRRGFVFEWHHPAHVDPATIRYIAWKITKYLFFEKRKRNSVECSAEVGLHHSRISGKRGARSLKHNAAPLDDIGVVGDCQCALGKLFRKQNGHPCST